MDSEIMAKVVRYLTDEQDEDIKKILKEWVNTEMIKQELYK